jgi:hypothetical protein
MRERNALVRVVLGLGMIACGACSSTQGSGGVSDIATEETVAESKAAIVARLEPQSGHTVTFYEIDGAGLFMVESSNGHEAHWLSGKPQDALEVYRKLSPETAIPEALQAAYERAKKLVPDEASPSTTALEFPAGGGRQAPEFVQNLRSQGDVGVVQQATSSSSASHFTGTHAACDAFGAAFSACRANWGGGFWAQWNGSTSATCNVDHYAGNGITVQLTAGSTVIPFSQAVNTFQTYSWGFVSGAVSRRIDILNASGDSFHVGCQFF